MEQEIIAFDAAYQTLKAKAISILTKANIEKGIDNIIFSDHNMQCRVLLADKYGCLEFHDVISIRIIDTPQQNTIQIITDNGDANFIHHCEAWSEIDLFKEIIAYQGQPHPPKVGCLSKG